MSDTVIINRFVVERKSMICGSAEAENRTFKMVLVYYHSESSGGSSNGPVYPTGKEASRGR